MDNPIVGLGHIDIQLEDGTVKRIGVTRAHLEEDAGKSIHDQFEGHVWYRFQPCRYTVT